MTNSLVSDWLALLVVTCRLVEGEHKAHVRLCGCMPDDRLVLSPWPHPFRVTRLAPQWHTSLHVHVCVLFIKQWTGWVLATLTFKLPLLLKLYFKTELYIFDPWLLLFWRRLNEFVMIFVCLKSVSTYVTVLLLCVLSFLDACLMVRFSLHFVFSLYTSSSSSLSKFISVFFFCLLWPPKFP